jgi:hypothetical protein
MATRLHLRVERPWATWSVVGIANWQDRALADAAFDPREFGLSPDDRYHLVDLWRGAYLGTTSPAEPFPLGPLAAHAVRLLAVHADVGRPQVIGSTGHLLGDMMDLQDEAWEPAARVLTLTPRASRRSGALLVYDPAGPLRQVPLTAPVSLRFR